MRLTNSAFAYGSVAKWIHWVTAALFLAAYGTVYFRQWFTEEKTPENWTALQLHLSIGISIGAIVLLRILWRLSNQTPTHEPGTALEHLAARLGHLSLYIIMIAAPITGYLGTGVDTEYFFMFNISKFESTALYQWLIAERMDVSFKEFEKPIDFLHKKILGEWVIWLLILGHVAAALYHHISKKDRTLKKMTVDSA